MSKFASFHSGTTKEGVHSMEQNLRETLSFYYNIQLQSVEDYGKVRKIIAREGIFALKETHLTLGQADELTHALLRLYKIGFTNIVPIVTTKFGECVLFIGEKTYYLMPWIEEVTYAEEESKEEKIATQLGIIHRLTVKTEPVIEEETDYFVQQLQRQWEACQLNLIRYTDEFEQKTYISPFELTFLTSAYLLDRMAELAQQFLQKWYDLCLEKKKFRTVLCHGKMDRTHALFSSVSKPLLINFERVCVSTPARDLAYFYKNSIPYTYWTSDEMERWLFRYERHLPLLEDEKFLLCAFLNIPEKIDAIVGKYVQEKEIASEIASVQLLKKELLTMRQVRQFTEQLIEMEQT